MSSILPPNETALLKDKDVAYRSAIPNYRDIIGFDPMTCDAKLLPYLAQVWQVLYWDKNWSETEMRKFVRDAREVHKHIGTPYALVKMFEAIDVTATIKEWYEYDGEPYHFNIDLSLETKEITIEIANRLRKYIEVYKNVRSVLDEISLSYLMQGKTDVATLCVGELYIEMKQVEEYFQDMQGKTDVATLCVGELYMESKMKEV